MKRYGLIGSPITHSLSPALFKAAYGGVYEYNLIEAADLDESLRLFQESYQAINVTAPYKESACLKADVRSPECEVIGACNVLQKTDDGVVAANTDYLGVMKCLIPHYSTGNLKPLTLVVGCGGAAKAAAYAACELGHEVVIINRDFAKADYFAQALCERNPLYMVSARPLSEFGRWFRKAGAIVYTLPLAIDTLTSLSRSEVRGGLFASQPKVILEANYRNPSFTAEVLSDLRKSNRNIVYISGREWLLHQAVEAFGIFTGKEPNIPAMMNVI